MLRLSTFAVRNSRANPLIFTVQQLRCYSQGMREEHDTFGPISVPSDRYWGAQTQRYKFRALEIHV